VSTALAVLGLATLLPLASLLVSVWLKGWQLQAVQSDSMAPTYPVGSLLVVEPIDASQVHPGMALVFEDPYIRGRIVTHRVVSRASGAALQFWTQGDANPTRDPYPVPARFVRGRVIWHVTDLGFITSWLRWPRSFLLLVVLPALWLGVDVWLTRRRSSESANLADAGIWS
jgi:signal peptidase